MGAYLSLSGREVGWGGHLLTFSAFRMGTYSRWVLNRGWALIRINTVCIKMGGKTMCLQLVNESS